eukprot:4593449-Karenia_brevis.AAC.1
MKNIPHPEYGPRNGYWDPKLAMEYRRDRHYAEWPMSSYMEKRKTGFHVRCYEQHSEIIVTPDMFRQTDVRSRLAPFSFQFGPGGSMIAQRNTVPTLGQPSLPELTCNLFSGLCRSKQFPGAE